MAASAANSSPDVFLYLGHGNEEPVPYEERPLVPEGSTVVLLTRSGRPLFGNPVMAVLSEMKENPELFKHPLENKTAIEALEPNIVLRIYPPGAPMPVMNYWPEGLMENKSPNYSLGESKWTYYKSGIYKFPDVPMLERKSYKENSVPIKNISFLYTGDENEELRTQIESLAYDGRVSIPAIKSIRFTTPELVARKGPGIHYFFNCRYVANLDAKSKAFMEPAIAEYRTFIRSIKAPLEAKLSTIQAQLKRWNTATNKRQLARDQKAVEDALFDIWYKYENQLNYLQQIAAQDDILPEEKLVYFRHALATNSYLNANHQKHEPLTNEEFNAQIRPKNNIASRHSTLKRNSVRKFNDVFGDLRTRLRLTRQKSQEFQRGLTKTRRRK